MMALNLIAQSMLLSMRLAIIAFLIVHTMAFCLQIFSVLLGFVLLVLTLS